MRINCYSVSDFLKNVDGQIIFHNTIYEHWKQTRIPNSNSWEIIYQLSAIVDWMDGSQALVVCGVNCGIDRNTADGGKEGSVERQNLHNSVVDYVKRVNSVLNDPANGIRLMPGVLEV